MLKVSYYIVLLLVLAGCSLNAKRPNFVPEKKEMAQLLAEIYQVEGAISQSGRSFNRNDDKTIGYYKDILDEYNLTKLEFDSAVSWYSSNPDLFSEVYDDVISILSKQDALLKKEIADKSKEKKEAIEDIPNVKDLWKMARNYTLPLSEADSIDVFFPFKISIDSIQSGILRLNAGYTLIKGNELDSALLKMYVYYADSTADTLQYCIKKTFKKQIGNVSQTIPEGKVLIGIEGLLFDHDTTKVSNVEIDDVKLTLLPKLGAAELIKR